MARRSNIKIVNLTGRTIQVIWPEPDCPPIEIEPDGRLWADDRKNGTALSREGVALKFRTWGDLNYELEYQEDVFYLIPSHLANHPKIKDRLDILIVKQLIKNDGRVEGCRFLQVLNTPDWLPSKQV